MHGFNHCQLLFLTPLYPVIQADLKFQTVTPILLFAGVYFFFYGISSIPFGILGDRFNKKVIMAYGLLLSSLAIASFGLTKDYRILIILFMIISNLQ